MGVKIPEISPPLEQREIEEKETEEHLLEYREREQSGRESKT